ncbi:hypothetical protein EC973_008494 [Apophysomyces ossiformis]|uniref:BZIP domain-containing protein n=1 Tax=Apophysomyces ossiformis TaxID=679940 RepID=A0A8H7BNA5_9FUNG|nr:hypothetical protein EC973_008494 [Apophysomyces ossiformis]
MSYSHSPIAAQPLAPSFRPSQPKSTRPVIPSKRAAQNRAAQKAFRQRRDQYVKDLESKAKEMDRWKEEIDQLRIENKQLRETVASLEKKIADLTGESISTKPASSSSPSTTHSAPPRSSPSSETDHASTSFSPIPLRAPHILPSEPPVDHQHQQAQQTPSQQQKPSTPQRPSVATPTPVKMDSMPYEPIHLTQITSPIADTPEKPTQQQQQEEHEQSELQIQQQQQVQTRQPPAPDLWHPSLELDFEFDPFFKDDFTNSTGPSEDQLDFISANSGQVLDDLFAMLQSRQRPQIPMQPGIGFLSLGDPGPTSTFDMTSSASEQS